MASRDTHAGSPDPPQVRLPNAAFILPLQVIRHIDVSRRTGERNASFATLPGISVSSCFTALAVTAHTLQHTNTLEPPPMYFVLKGCQRHTWANLYVFERYCNGSWTVFGAAASGVSTSAVYCFWKGHQRPRKSFSALFFDGHLFIGHVLGSLQKESSRCGGLGEGAIADGARGLRVHLNHAN